MSTPTRGTLDLVTLISVAAAVVILATDDPTSRMNMLAGLLKAPAVLCSLVGIVISVLLLSERPRWRGAVYLTLNSAAFIVAFSIVLR